VSCDQKYWNTCSKKCGGKILCGDCIKSKCGWCSSSESSNCMFGSINGPFNTTCNSTWAFGDINKCPKRDECSSISYCGACAANSNCGWCHANSRCMTGNLNGPKENTCSDWSFTKCPTYSAKKLWWAWLLGAIFVVLLISLVSNRWNTSRSIANAISYSSLPI